MRPIAVNCAARPWFGGHGGFATTLAVRRVLGGVDCVTQRCAIRTVSIVDDRAAAVAVRFDPGVPPVPGPTVTVTPNSGLVDGQFVTVSTAGMSPNGLVAIIECVTGGGPDSWDVFSAP